MRVTTDPTDPHYSAAPRRVWCQDVEIHDWTVADEFRRVVITVDGKVHNGAVRVERVEADRPAAAPDPAPAQPEGFVGVFEHVPDAPAATPAPEPELVPEPLSPALESVRASNEALDQHADRVIELLQDRSGPDEIAITSGWTPPES
jgi:hypothetical protein